MTPIFDPPFYLSRINGVKKPLFEKYYELLTEYNARFNLTAITEKNDVYEKHFLDSVMGEGLFPKNASVLEVGSGAGFPSLPLKILREDLSFTLVESTGKKCDFLNTVIRELGLSDVTVLNERAETLAHDPAYREQYDVCCARAVARLNTLAEYCLPFVKVGGTVLAYKAESDDEQREAISAIQKLGGRTAYRYRYGLLDHGIRTLVCIEKISPTPKRFPRGQGKERKDPL